METINELQKWIDNMSDWSIRTFKGGHPRPVLYHLSQEVQELIQAINEKESIDDVHEEFADCFILLTQAADFYGMTIHELIAASEKKLRKNKRRKWGTPDANGVVNHIKK